METERKLSAIFASDAVGFSKMMATNEQKTLEVLQQRREVIDSLIGDHNGKVFGSAGDSVIAEFPSPIKATECAVQMQNQMKALNEGTPEGEQMVFRVGINVGDVMATADNLFGDAVNIAARLEAAAQPGGICLSKAMFEMINQKVQVSFEDAGQLELKNIPQPVQAYFVVLGLEGTRYLQYSEAPQAKVEAAEPGSLAVMLFKNLSKDEEQGYFCEGFSEDLISALSKYRKLMVVSGNASFSYRDQNKSPKEIGKELGVRYLLEGSVRKLGSRMRISTSLIAADRENTVWSDNFDTTLDEIFDVQDELVEKIVYTLVGRVEADEAQQLTTKPPENRTAYDLVLQGLEHHRKAGVSQEHAEQAVSLFEQAIEADPNYARAYAWRACALGWKHDWNPEQYGENWRDPGIASVTKALELDPNDHEAHRIMGSISMFKRDYEKARHHHARAVELCPSDAYILGKNAATLVYYGEPEEALESVQRAVRINPFCPDDLLLDEGMCHFWMGNFNEAVDSLQKIKQQGRDSLCYLAAAYAKSGDTEKAKDTLRQIAQKSDKAVEAFLVGEPYKDASRTQELREVLESLTA